MSIEIIEGKGGAVLTDTVDGMAFGPVFADEAEASAFTRWFLHEYGGPINSAGVDKYVADKWRTFLAEHKAEECPYDDRESYGVGYTGDHDVSYGDYTAAVPTPCECECHWRKEEVKA